MATRRLLGCGAVAGPLFVATFLAEGAARADYDPLRHPVSSLALGPRGWVQTLNFGLAGALYLVGAVGLARAEDVGSQPCTGEVLIGAAAVGLIGAGAFVTDLVSGYPPGATDAPASYTTSGALHDLLSVPTFVGIPAAALIYARRFARNGGQGWAAYSAASGVVMLAATILASAAFSQRAALVAYGGLLQRTAVTTGFAWLTSLSLHALRTRYVPQNRPRPTVG